MTSVTRPIVRYHGGKWKLAPWIIAHLPNHRVYVEPFGGAASVLLRKPRSYAEVYNDLDGDIVNLFRIVRDHGAELLAKLQATPFARAEFVDAWLPTDDDMERARRSVVRAFMGFGSAAVSMRRNACGNVHGGVPSTGFRSNSTRSGTTPAGDWANYPAALSAIIQRLQGVVIENRDALDIMRQHDGDTTLHYVDPPYVAATRDAGDDYAVEMSDGDHARLADVLRGLRGRVVLSGYRSDLYDDLYADWHRIEKAAHADGARPRVECLWLSPSCDHQGELFAWSHNGSTSPALCTNG